MAYHSKYSGVEVDALLDKIKDDNVGSIDSSLSTTSENPVKNKVITEELNKKANKTDIATINGQPLTNGGNIEVVTDAYDDTEIKGKLTELDSQIDGEATARTNADAELQTQINSKQEALTLTVKDNGNIVLANIQGQSKEFMPATPSGDPMHYAYVAAGAIYNDTGADIVKTAPWADLADDDADKTVVHKAGYWYLNGLGDITNTQMRNIYLYVNSFVSYSILEAFYDSKIRTNFNLSNTRGDFGIVSCTAAFTRSMIEVLYCGFYINIGHTQFFLANTPIKYVIGRIRFNKGFDNNNAFKNCKNLCCISLARLSKSISLSDSPLLSTKSVLYAVNNEEATSPITITLHADVYNRCMANADILAALEQHTNVSLASA